MVKPSIANWEACTTCHAGYGWKDETFDFEKVENVDCLVCHEQSGGYVKGKKGLPAEGVDLLAVAKSVALPTRDNCGSCHFRGGGGNGHMVGYSPGGPSLQPDMVDISGL